MRTAEAIRKDLNVVVVQIAEEENKFREERLDAEHDFCKNMKEVVDQHFDRLARIKAQKTSLENELIAATSKNGPLNRMIG